MSEVTRVLNAIDAGDAKAADQLLPLVYKELRQLAAMQMARETPGQTLEPTALVHEAYLRLVGPADQPRWRGRSHFYMAAAESMRRILVDAARRRQTAKRGAGNVRAEIDPDLLAVTAPSDELLALDEALERFAAVAPQQSELVKLRFYAGCTLVEAAKLLNISPREADRYWAYAKAWLKIALADDSRPADQRPPI